MECVAVVVASQIELNPNGSLKNIIEVFNTITAQRFPIDVKGLMVWVRLVADPAEYGSKYALRVELVNEDGTVISQWAKDKVVPAGKDRKRILVDQVFGLPNSLIPKAGVYQLSVLVNDEMRSTYPIDVLRG
jgi:hypothetical protein